MLSLCGGDELLELLEQYCFSFCLEYWALLSVATLSDAFCISRTMLSLVHYGFLEGSLRRKRLGSARLCDH